jgi:hypothetical protein
MIMKRISSFLVVLLATAIAALLFPQAASSQVRRLRVVAPKVDLIEVGRGFRLPIASPAEDEDIQEVGGAVLKTDPDLEALLDKANRHAEDGNFRVATRLWQAVLERSGDSLYSEDEVTYFSISDQVERILAELPGDALAIYRVTADASAQQILTEANDPNDIGALMRVAGNYFVSSKGDDAAFRLGCLYLDRHDFSGALRVFKKIATQHPDPSVSLDEVHARIAICHAFMGNEDLARASLVSGRGFGADSEAVDAVERSLGSLTPTEARGAALEQWHGSHGNSKRMAAMPSLPESAFTVDQIAKWQFYVTPRDDRFISRPDTIGKVLVGPRSSDEFALGTRNTTEKKAIKEWAENGLRPAGHLMFDDDKVMFKAPADLVAFDRNKISAAIAENMDDPKVPIQAFASWRSLWRNVYEVDQATMRKHQLSGNMRFGSRQTRQKANSARGLSVFPKTMHFGDLIHHQMAIHDEVLYTIEGKSYGDRSRHPATRRNAGHGWNVNFRRTRENFLTAYEKDSGQMLWRIPRVNVIESPTYDPTRKIEEPEDVDRWLRDGGMMAAPVKFADLLIVPVNRSGAIYLYGIDPEKEGETVWSAFLCDEPETGSVASAPINLTIDGSDLFATCGTGVLFVVDPTTGKIRFAKRYARAGEADEQLRRINNAAFTKFDGWSSDVILPNGRELICFCSDTNSITAIDRNNGSLIWKTGLRPYGTKVDYIIGAWGDYLYLGGKRTIIALDLKAEGYIAWGGEPLFDDAVTTGRGMVTEQGVFVPVGNAIWRFSLEGKNGRAESLNQVEAFLGTESPVGNLYSDGQRIWVHGASRLYALSPKQSPKED